MKESEKAAFMGKIAAGLAHEIKNVLAIIRESAGLVEDLAAIGKSAPGDEKCVRALARVAEQVKRGVDIASTLNTFAHLPDHALDRVDLRAAAQQAVTLSARFARLKGISLDTAVCDTPVMARTDPLALQALLFLAVDAVMNGIETGDTLTLSVESGGTASIKITAGASTWTPPVLGQELRDLAESLCFTIRVGQTPVMELEWSAPRLDK
jgi:C4-dicarboxylate-specific signal transduction histidine kinase